MQEWALTINKKWVIVGDSNLARFPPLSCDDLQIDSYPGATLGHATHLISKATVSTKVEKIILAFGLNNRGHKVKKNITEQLLAAVKAADDRFPEAEVWVPLINYSRLLPAREQNNLIHLNYHIKKNCLHIPELSAGFFSTLRDHVHWTKGTARRILEHWINHVKYMSP